MRRFLLHVRTIILFASGRLFDKEEKVQQNIQYRMHDIPVSVFDFQGKAACRVRFHIQSVADNLSVPVWILVFLTL